MPPEPSLPTYTKAQIRKYYDRIGLPQALRADTVSKLSPKAALQYLTLLQKHQLVSVPFENLSLHYSPCRLISLHHEDLYQKIIENGARGGYCMELNAVFGTLLRSLDYSVYPTGARVHNGDEFGAWNHMLNIVTIADLRYLVDVGFGANYCQIQPLPLVHDEIGSDNMAPAAVRLVCRAIEGNLNQLQKLWVYQHRLDPESEFKDMYCFADIEFRPADFETMNYYTSTSPKSIFTQSVMCTKMVFGEGDKKDDIAGVLVLTEAIKKRVGFESWVLMEFQNEDDRMKALEEYFDITLTQAGRDAIRGTVAEIKPLSFRSASV